MRDGLGGIQSVAVVGGTSDIGLAIARALTKLGANRYILAGRDVEAMRRASEDLPATSFVELDVVRDEHEQALNTLFADGDIDVVVLAAGTLNAQPSPQEIGEMARVNGAGSIALLAGVADRLRTQGHGHLVVLSSIAVVRPRPSNYWYGASKVGLDFAARGLADDLDGSTVRVSVVRPGFVRSKMTEGMKPAPLSCNPEDVGQAVAGAIGSDAGGVVWVPGALRYLAWILRILPMGVLRRIDR